MCGLRRFLQVPFDKKLYEVYNVGQELQECSLERNYYSIIGNILGLFGIMEKKMEATRGLGFRVNIGTMEKRMETTTVYRCFACADILEHVVSRRRMSRNRDLLTLPILLMASVLLLILLSITAKFATLKSIPGVLVLRN